MEIALFIDNVDSYIGKDIKAYSFVWGCKENGIKESMDIIKKNVDFNQKISYLYFGSEFCEYLIPGENEVNMYMDICIEEKIVPVFVTPPVSEYGMNMIEKCINHLLCYDVETEIIVNDVGVLELLNSYKQHFKLCLGRLFDKTSHESRVTMHEMKKYYGNTGEKYARTVGLTADYSLSVFKDYGIERMEFDLPKVGLNLNKKGKYSLYWPYQYMTTGRVCMIRANNYSGNDKFLVGSETCNKLCKKIQVEKRKPINEYVFENGKRINNLYLFQRGNSLFYVHTQEMPKCDFKQFDRLVLQL